MTRTLDDGGGMLLGWPLEMQTRLGPPVNGAGVVELLCRPWRLTEAIALEIPEEDWATTPWLGFCGRAWSALPCLKQ